MDDEADGIQAVMLEGGGIPCSALLYVVDDDDGSTCVICWIADGRYYDLKLKKYEARLLSDRINNTIDRHWHNLSNANHEASSITEVASVVDT